ncbi:MAG: hypothetical protein M2R45_05125 [Verrucomicrobia subdivision 3 bacterium]|nr:hypothetical protein [Limisphaerales bacterium]MCS1417187.1 hypothetical protein [Limisphaerales bacterium]
MSLVDRERLDNYLQSVCKRESDLLEARAWLNRPKLKVDQTPPQDIPGKSDLIGRVPLAMSLVSLIVQAGSSRIATVW